MVPPVDTVRLPGWSPLDANVTGEERFCSHGDCRSASAVERRAHLVECGHSSAQQNAASVPPAALAFLDARYSGVTECSRLPAFF